MTHAPRPLTPAQHRIVVLLYHEELNYPMIARRLGLSIRTVRGHVASVAAWLPGHGDPAWKVLRHAADLLASRDTPEQGAA